MQIPSIVRRYAPAFIGLAVLCCIEIASGLWHGAPKHSFLIRLPDGSRVWTTSYEVVDLPLTVPKVLVLDRSH